MLGALLAAHMLTSSALAATPAAAAVPVSLAASEPTHRKSVNLFLVAAELGASALAAYLGFLGGAAVNFTLGGLSAPPDAADYLLLGALPAAFAAGVGWLVGLLDLGQRSLLGSLLSAAAGGVAGEIAGLFLGYGVGQGVAPGDFSGAAAIALLIAPAVAAVGAVLFMELFKPGETVASASLLPVRDGRGLVGFVPALALRF